MCGKDFVRYEPPAVPRECTAKRPDSPPAHEDNVSGRDIADDRPGAHTAAGVAHNHVGLLCTLIADLTRTPRDFAFGPILLQKAVVNLPEP
jgi:hypothetical protein